MVDLQYGFLSVRYEVTGFGHNDHGSFPVGVWHIEHCVQSETMELAIAEGDMSEPPAAHIATVLTAMAADGWRAEETTQVTQQFHDRRYENLLIRVARASVATA